MPSHANLKRKNLFKLLNWLSKKGDITVKEGNNHLYNISYIKWDKVYPVYLKHSEVNKNVAKTLMNKLVKSGICTEEEFLDNLR